MTAAAHYKQLPPPPHTHKSTQEGVAGGTKAPIEMFTGEHTIKTPLDASQKTEGFRAALAFALALNRLAPEPPAPVSLTTRCANDDSVSQFRQKQLENPLTPKVRGMLACGD